MLNLLFASFILLIAVNRKHFVQAQTPNPPLNAAANVGDKVVINCTSGASMIPRWRYSSGSLSFTSISDVGICNSLFPTRFVAESTGPGNCNLIIPSATTAEALTYQCEDGGSFDHLMALTIIDSVEVSPNSASEEPCSGDLLTITCSVKYSAVSTSDLQMFPLIMWTNLSANANISGITPSPMPPNVMTSYLSIAVTPPTVLPCKCNVYFNAPNVTLQGFATNAPNYYKSTNTTELLVQYMSPPRIETIRYIEPSDGCEARVLQCIPNAHPPPNIQWTDIKSMEAFDSSTITAEFNGTYKCVTQNTIRGENMIASKVYTVSENFAQPPCKFVALENMEIIMNDFQSCDNDTCLCPCCSEVSLTCHVPAHPEAEYKWFYGEEEKEGATVKATQNGNYTCNAFNTVNNRRSNATKSVVVYGFYACKTCNESGPDNTDSIILGVFLGLSLLLNFALIAYHLFHVLRKRNSPKDAAKSRDVNGSNGDFHHSQANSHQMSTPYEALHRDPDPLQPTTGVYEELSK